MVTDAQVWNQMVLDVSGPPEDYHPQIPLECKDLANDFIACQDRRLVVSPTTCTLTDAYILLIYHAFQLRKALLEGHAKPAWVNTDYVETVKRIFKFKKDYL